MRARDLLVAARMRNQRPARRLNVRLPDPTVSEHLGARATAAALRGSACARFALAEILPLVSLGHPADACSKRSVSVSDDCEMGGKGEETH